MNHIKQEIPIRKKLIMSQNDQSKKFSIAFEEKCTGPPYACFNHLADA